MTEVPFFALPSNTRRRGDARNGDAATCVGIADESFGALTGLSSRMMVLMPCFRRFGVPAFLGANASTGAMLPSGLTTQDAALDADCSILFSMPVAASTASSTLMLLRFSIWAFAAQVTAVSKRVPQR